MKQNTCIKTSLLLKGSLLVFTGLSVMLGIFGLAVAETDVIWCFSDFNNRADSDTASFYGGHVQEIPASGVALVESSFGQMVSNEIPYGGVEQTAIALSRKMLYYEYGDDRESSRFYKENAAFRYKHKLYEIEAEKLGKWSWNDAIEDFWGSEALVRAEQAKGLIEAAMVVNRQHTSQSQWSEQDYTDLRNAWLDIYYEMAVVNSAVAAKKMADANMTVLKVPPQGGFLISEEIDSLAASVDRYEEAIQPYFELLQTTIGSDNEDDEDYLNPPIRGYDLFQEMVPQRSLYAMSIKDAYSRDLNCHFTTAECVETSNTGGEPLVSGYKDMITLFQIERDAARASERLARLYGQRSATGDADNACNLIARTQQRLYTGGHILRNIFPDIDTELASPPSQDPPPEQPPEQPGWYEAHAGWAHALSALPGIKNFLDGTANPLGLPKGLLVLMQTEIEGTNATNIPTSTFDELADDLLPGGNTPDGVLTDAKDAYDTAYSQYEKVRLFQDDLKTEFEDYKTNFGTRLYEIAGVWDPDDPEFGTPEDNIGSEINIQWSNIDIATLRIRRNDQEIENLKEQIRIKQDLQQQTWALNQEISNTYEDYGERQADLTRAIGHINAGQTLANGLADAAASSAKSDLGTIATMGGTNVAIWAIKAGNAVLQAGLEEWKGAKEAEKDRLAGELDAAVADYNAQITDAEYDAQIKELLLEAKTLAIDSLEAAVMLKQEMAKLQALYDEMLYIQARWTEVQESLADRYIADPSHQYILDARLSEADYKMREAKFWVYLMARALDYKWNVDVTATYANRTYSSQSVFALRNAEELVEMAKALYQYNKTESLGIFQDLENDVRFSFKKDVLGYTNTTEAVYRNPRPLQYGNEGELMIPQTDESGNAIPQDVSVGGEQELAPEYKEYLNATEAFRMYLKYVAPRRPPADVAEMFSEALHLEFGITEPNESGTLFSTTNWNEKIKCLNIHIRTTEERDPFTVWLEQSGRAHIRKSDDTILELPVQSWVKDENDAWVREEAVRFDITAGVTNLVFPNLNSSVWEDQRHGGFAERSPAATTWILDVPLTSKNGDFSSANFQRAVCDPRPERREG